MSTRDRERVWYLLVSEPYLAHPFLLSSTEVEPLDDARALPSRRLLIAGIGNFFLGDDGFGVEVVRRLTDCVLPPGVEA